MQAASTNAQRSQKEGGGSPTKRERLVSARGRPNKDEVTPIHHDDPFFQYAHGG